MTTGNSLLRFCGRSFCVFVVLLTCAQISTSYSVLTHEEIVDLLWTNPLMSLLRERFPAATADELRQAHGFAYGGCLIQDMGYYPFGNREFSYLVHYVRSGDFVEALILDSTTLDEYAFALGALAHYASDISGHPAINHSVALRFPKLRKKFGEFVTYVDDPKAHIRTEFGFDVTQVAKNRFPPDSYHDFIGFEVAQPLLERAFKETYGFEMKDLFRDLDLSIGTYRRSVSKIIPEMTRVALLTKRADLVREIPNFNKRQFLYRLSRAHYEKQWGRKYQKPGVGARVLAFIFHLIPKVGPFKAIAFELPTPATENLYLKSVDDTVTTYRRLLLEVRTPPLQLDNRDFDTGKQTKAGEYSLTDDTYAKLLDKIAQHHFSSITPELRDNILSFYSDLNAPISTKRHADRWRKTLAELAQLRSNAQPTPTSPIQTNSSTQISPRP